MSDKKRIIIYVPLGLADRVDAWRKAREKSEPGLNLSRNAAIGMLLEKALAAEPKRR